MAAKRVRGLTIEIGGDTSGLSKALTEVRKETNSIQIELREVEKALKLNPKNTELLAQKQQLLSRELDTTKIKLEALKNAKDELDKAMQAGTEVNQKQYRGLQREIIATESRIKTLEQETSKSRKSFESFGEGVGKAGDKLTGIGQKGMAVTGMIAGVATGMVAAAEETREYREDLNRLDAAFLTSGKTVEQARKVYSDFYAILGESDRSVEAVNHLAKLCQSEEELVKWTNICAGVSATFGDSLPIEGLTEAANETAKVAQVTGPLADALNWVGISEDEFNKKLAATNSEKERSILITETLNTAYQNASGEFKNLNADVIASREATQKFNDAMAQIGEIVEPVITAVKNKIAELIGWFTNLTSSQQILIGVIGLVVAAIPPLLILLGSILTSISAINAAILPSVGIIAAIVAAVAGLIAIIVNLYNKCEWFRDGINAIFEQIKIAWDMLVTAIRTIWENQTFQQIWTNTWTIIKTVFQQVLDNIKTIFQFFIAVFSGDFEGAFNILKDFFQRTWERIKVIFQAWSDSVKAIFEGVKNFFINIWNSIAAFFSETIPQIVNNIINWFGELPEKIGELLGFVVGKLTKWGIDSFNTVKEWVPKILTSIYTWFQELPGKLWDLLLKAIAKIKEWGINILNWCKTDLPNVIVTIVNFFNELPGKIYQVGKDLITGLWNGITGSFNWLVEKIKGFCSGVINGFKKAFDINSPSRVMKNEIGLMISKGIAEGIEDGTKDIEKTIGNFVSIGSTSAESFGIGFLGKFKSVFSEVRSSISSSLGTVTSGYSISSFGNSGMISNSGVAIVGKSGAELLKVIGGNTVVQPLNGQNNSGTSAGAVVNNYNYGVTPQTAYTVSENTRRILNELTRMGV